MKILDFNNVIRFISRNVALIYGGLKGHEIFSTFKVSIKFTCFLKWIILIVLNLEGVKFILLIAPVYIPDNVLSFRKHMNFTSIFMT